MWWVVFLVACSASPRARHGDGAVATDDETDTGPIVTVDPAPPRWFRDEDGDGFGWERTSRRSDVRPDGYVDNFADCDDTRADAHPGAPETCNGADDDCDRTVDAADPDLGAPVCAFLDVDRDGYGEAAQGVPSDVLPAGRAAVPGDCDDVDPTVHPDAFEVDGDGVDADCDGEDGGGNDFSTLAAGAVELDVLTGMLATRIGDVDGDGRPDLALFRAPYSYFGILTDDDAEDVVLSSASVARGDPSPTLARWSVEGGRCLPWDAGDLDGDGRSEIWSPRGPECGTVDLRTSTGDILATLAPPAEVRVDSAVSSSADVGAHEGVALAYERADGGHLEVRGPTGLLAWASWPLKGGHDRVALTDVGDVDGDGGRDLLVSRWTDGDTEATLDALHPGVAQGELTLGPSLAGAFPTGQPLALGDVDGDGVPDVAIGGRLYTGGPAGWAHGPVLELDRNPEVVGDLDGDGTVELRIDGEIVFGLLDPSATRTVDLTLDLTPPGRSDRYWEALPGAWLAADLDGDGSPELIGIHAGWYDPHDEDVAGPATLLWTSWPP